MHMEENIVPTNIPYTSTLLALNLHNLLTTYPFINVQTVGNSVLGKSLYVIKLGNGPKKVFYNASFHANEWITSIVLMKFIEDYCKAYVSNQNLYEYSVRNLFKTCSIYLMPMVNPDGVDLVNGNISISSFAYQQAKNIASSFPDISFPSGWKANIEGVDLNLQFPAGWEQAKKIKYAQGFTRPAPRDFVGFGPLTTPEALSIYNFTLAHNFRLVIAYHTQGKEIYWKFQHFNPSGSLAIGKLFAQSSGYTLAETPYNSSFAGYKDWFIQTYNRPGYTIEAGIGENPLPISQFDEIYKDNLGILVLGAIL